MGKHYVPQHYLKGFTHTDTPKALWQFDKDHGRFGNQPYLIKDIAQGRDFYSEATEDALTQNIEQPAQQAINRLRERDFYLPLDEREALALYMATMVTRVPASRHKAAKQAPESFQGTIDRINIEIDTAYQMEFITLDRRDALLSGVQACYDKNRDNPAALVREQIECPFAFQSAFLAIAQMRWRYITTKKTFFVTSDNPLFYFTGLGVGRDNSEITFPIDSRLSLHGSNNKIGGQRVRRDEQLAKEFNRRIISHATRFVFAMQPASWVSTVAAKKYHRLNEINWGRVRHIATPQ